jgi:GNAT superfamily N-acetyltransferase
MRPADVPRAEEISDAAFHDLDVRLRRASDPAPEPRSAERSARWISRTLRFLETDPGGCWVAEDDTGVVGIATSLVRDEVWILVTFAVDLGHQGRGIGGRLMRAAEEYGAGCPRGLLSASDDPMALRRYHSAGFALHPQLSFRGTVDHSTLPAVDGVRAGSDEDLTWIDDLDRTLRGGPHGPDHAHLGAMARLLVADDRSGYAYTTEQASYVVAGRDPAAASRMLVACLAAAEGEFEVSHVTTANPWAIDVAMRARLAMSTHGHLGVRGMAPPASYVHNGALL